jgi:hypothetical protein
VCPRRGRRRPSTGGGDLVCPCCGRWRPSAGHGDLFLAMARQHRGGGDGLHLGVVDGEQAASLARDPMRHLARSTT